MTEHIEVVLCGLCRKPIRQTGTADSRGRPSHIHCFHRASTRSEAPSIRSGVGVVVVKQGKFLVARRLAGSSGGVGCLSLPGGKVAFGETFFEAAVREVREETGLYVVPRQVIPGLGVVFHAGERIADGEHHISYYLVADVVGGELGNPEPDKHDDWEFASLSGVILAATAGVRHWLPLGALVEHRDAIGI